MNIIRVDNLCKILCASRSTIYRLIKDGELPPRVTISPRIKGWLKSDIQQWLEDRQYKTNTLNKIGEIL